MNELDRRGSRKRKGASQHLKQGTLFDHFLVTRKPSPAPALARPDDLKDDGQAQTVIDQTGIEGYSGSLEPREPFSAKSAGDINDIAPSPHDTNSSTQCTADVFNTNTGQSQESCSLYQEHVPPPSPYDVSSAADSSPIDVGLVTGSDSPEFGPSSPPSGPNSPRRDSSHVIDLTLDEGTENTPILIEGSPVRELPRPTLASSSHIPFQPLPLRRRKQQRDKTSPDAPFPDASMQHVRDSSMSVQGRSIDLARRRRGTSECLPDPGPCISLKQIPTTDEIANGHLRCHRRVRPSERQADASVVLNCHGDLHPAISSIFGLASELQGVKETSQQHWNHKWRPRRAEHILGNEQNACYLRKWMHALRLHFDTASSSNLKMTKSKKNYKKRKRAEQRPEVVREVTRKRQRAGDLDGWMVDDDDDDTNEDHEAYEDFSDCSLPSSRDLQEPRGISFGRKIRNTILLVGPPGCGKTAAVYACAEELGWSVFEVYPGVGKRGGTHLEDLIGDVGKNHTLPQPLLFHRCRSEPPSPAKQRSKNGVNTSDKLSEAEIHPQSVVLIEEADVVFADEASFWPSVVTFIKECRRPVIITCNDASLVPVETLPLQATLTFSLPPTSLALSLLGAICQLEGRPTAKPEEVPYPDGQVPTTDLRQCISQRQLGLADSGDQSLGQQAERAADMIFALRVNPEKPTAIEPELDERRNLCVLLQSLRGADSASHLDACVLLSQPHDLEIAENHPDDQVGPSVLRTTQRPRMPVHPEYYCRDIDMATEALRSFEGILERCFPRMPLDDTREITPWPSGDQYRNRLWEGLKTDPALESMLNLPRLYLDYRPLIGAMVREEDKEMERAAERVKGRSGRLTQNSQKRQKEDVRWLSATEELRGAIRAGGLCCSW
ncbi:hypothetical protein BJV78DRAFT_75808 [Lactifluus subvellereus]|nr:hypothetical protein BJV78DRAFT_75808 [Lactifluus subvellereus]